MAGKTVQGAQSFSRGMAVLQAIADSDRPPGVGDLVRSVALSRPTLYRILAALEVEGLVRQMAGRRYLLGTRLIGLAHRALAQHDIRSHARDAMTALRDSTGETVHLAVRDREEMVYIDKIESLEVVRMASTVGTRVPFHTSSVGKAYLAALPLEEAEALIDRLTLTPVTERSVGDRRTLRDAVERARKRGYSADEEENETGIVCFGAAIRDASQCPVASVSVSVPTFRLRDEAELYWRPLVEQCAAVSRRLGAG